MSKLLIISALILGLSFSTYCQVSQTAKIQRFSINGGVGLVTNDGFEGAGGPVAAVGYQYPFAERCSFEPNVQVGAFRRKADFSSRDRYFNAATINLPAHFTFLKFGSLSFDVGLGGFVGYTSGFIGNGFKYENSVSIPVNKTEFYSSWSVGLVGSGRVLFTPKNGRISVSITPANVQYGTNGFRSINSFVGLAYRL